MSTATLTPAPSVRAARAGDVDNLGTYISFGLAYVLGHGASALSTGPDPLIDMPSWLPMTLLGTGFGVGTVIATRAALRSRAGTTTGELLTGKLLGLSWVIAFGALFLGIIGFTSAVNLPDLQSVLMPAGSGFVVGLIYLAEGAARRNVLHYCVGAWIALVSATGLLFDAPTLFWVLAIAGGGGYAVATLLEHRRLVVSTHRSPR